MKKGLVMEGGAMRGLFTAGVIDVLMENNIEFDGIIGVSAGAAFGCNIKSKQIGRALRYNINYCRDKRYCSFRSLLLTKNMFGAEFCYHELPEKLDIFDVKTFRENPVPFYVVATDVETGKPVYLRCDNADFDDLERMRASASMPLVSEIVSVDGKKLLDGGVSDSIPVKEFKRMGYGKNVVVLTQPRDYIKGKNKLMWLSKLILGKYPNLIYAMEHRHEAYNEQRRYLMEEEKKGNAFVICPDLPLPAGRIEHDAEKLKQTYEAGRKKATELLIEMKKFLSE